ncbi:Holliday junction DNA helicase RuvA [Actinoplanes sp. SE50]|uniref:Holliday junction branch migration protein RuvA n=1 Tax=unclassified Actinoplanes TaxID=2626549 RepID=UPI00023EBDF2|nr:MULTISPECIES: Holliday junction branch migration protein RuvA [unclassified Actinoplanes]AEV87416.1 Holliday junction ATP-dependent DNA helicase ruvA [Actinoplanes sp. SE50/110]ATO85818.1 Holliday junction DNA helicase RuvA [Actinoplanes sp. SE50]SLM03231.1 Holliday junction ATP-dependent DNA helicase RuvA [Actinoplanes sp. SE50/110]
MIASVRGRVAAILHDSTVVEVGGVGMRVFCTPNTLAALRTGAEARLATTLIVREDSLTLYGFADDDERQLFELLLTANGVGPRIAQAVLAVHQPDAVRRAIGGGDIAALTQVPGIGKRGAEKMIVELKDKIGPVGFGDAGGTGVLAGAWQEQVRQGVLALGWSATQADQAVAAIGETIDGEVPPVPILLRQAIRLLGRTR